MKKYMAAILIIIPAAIGAAVWFGSKPNVEKQLGVQLPKSMAVVKFKKHPLSGDIDIKLSFDEDDFALAARSLEEFCQNECYIRLGDNERLPYFQNIISWWDLDISKVEFAYQNFTGGRWGLKTKEQYVIVGKAMDGNTYFYLVL